MDDDAENQDRHFSQNYLRPRGIFSPLVVDYYNRHGRGRDLEQYFSLMTASPEPEVAPAVFNSLQEETNYITSRTDANDQPIVTSTELICEIEVEKTDNKKDEQRETEVNLIDLSSDYDSSPRKINTSKNENVHNDTKTDSPTGSMSSHRKLEWDSLADVGYNNENLSGNFLSSIEKIALKHRLKDQKNNSKLVQRSSSDCPEITQLTETINIGKPSAQSTPLSTTENSPIYSTVINKKKSILKSSQKSHPLNSKTPNKSQQKNKYKEKLIKDEMKTFLKCQKAKQPSNISVNLTRHYNLNLGFDKKVNLDNSDIQSQDNDLAQPDKSVIVKEENNPSQSSESQVPLSMINKEIQTSTREHASTSVQTSVLPDEESKMPKGRGSIMFIPTKSRHILSHPPVIVNIKSPKSFSFKLPKRRPLPSAKHAKDSKVNESLRSTAKDQQISPSKQGNVKPSEGLLSRADSFEYMPGHMYHIERSRENLHQDSSSKFTNSSSSQHISSSSNYSVKPQKERVSTMRRDLEKSVSLLNKILETHHRNAALKKQLVKNVVKKLLKTHYSDDETSSDLISGLSFHSSKIGLHHEISSGRSITSDSYLSNHYVPKYPKNYKETTVKNDYKKFFGSDSISSRNESSDKSDVRISFEEWMKPKTKCEKIYTLQKERSKLCDYLQKKTNFIEKKMSDSSRPVSMLQTNHNPQSDQAQPVLVNEQIQVDFNTAESHYNSSLRKEMRQLSYLQKKIKDICSDASSVENVSKITHLLNDIIKVSSIIAEHRTPKAEMQNAKTSSSCTLSQKTSRNQSPTEVPPLNLKKSSSEDSSLPEESSDGSKDITDKSDPKLLTDYIKSEVRIPRQDTPRRTKLINLECTDGDIIDKIFLESLQPQEKKIQDPNESSPSLLDPFKFIGDATGKSSAQAITSGGILKSCTLPNINRHLDHPPQRNAFTLGNMISIPERKIDVNLKILNQKHLLKTSPTKRSQEIQTEASAKNKEQYVNTRNDPKADDDNNSTDKKFVSDQFSKQIDIGNNQLSADILSELISCLHRTFVQLKLNSSSKNADSLNMNQISNTDMKPTTSSKSKEKSLKISKHCESNREFVTSSSKGKNSSDPSTLGSDHVNENRAHVNRKSYINKSKYDIRWSKTVKNESSKYQRSQSSSDQHDNNSVRGREDSSDKVVNSSYSKHDTTPMKRPNSEVEDMTSCSSLELNEKTSYNMIRDLVKQYKHMFDKTHPTEEFTAKLIEIFTNENKNIEKDSARSKKTFCKKHALNKCSCRKPDCKSEHHSLDGVESESTNSLPIQTQRCEYCNKHKARTDLKSAFTMCPQYKIPRIICPCHCEKYRNLYSQLLDKTHARESRDIERIYQKPQYPKAVAYNLIVEPTSVLRKQNRKVKKKVLPDVVVRVPKFGEWFDYYENDKMQSENNKENQFKRDSDKSSKNRPRSGLFESNHQSASKRGAPSQYDIQQKSESSCGCNSYSSENSSKSSENNKEIDSRTITKGQLYKADTLENNDKPSESFNSSVVSSQLTLQDYLIRNRANFIKAAERRRSMIKTNGEERKQITNEADEALFNFATSNIKELYGTQQNGYAPRAKIPLYTEREIKQNTLKVVRNLPEKRRENELIKKMTKQKINNIRSQIFKKKLQRKTLEGNVNIPIRSAVMAS